MTTPFQTTVKIKKREKSVQVLGVHLTYEKSNVDKLISSMHLTKTTNPKETQL